MDCASSKAVKEMREGTEADNTPAGAMGRLEGSAAELPMLAPRALRTLPLKGDISCRNAGSTSETPCVGSRRPAPTQTQPNLDSSEARMPEPLLSSLPSGPSEQRLNQKHGEYQEILLEKHIAAIREVLEEAERRSEAREVRLDLTVRSVSRTLLSTGCLAHDH